MNSNLAKSLPNLLLVENHGPLRSFWSEQLGELGFTVTTAESGDRAQTVIQSGTRVDVLFSDIRMPGHLDGLQLARWVRQHYPWILVVLQTGSLDDLPKEFLVLRKPFTASDFLRCLQEALQAREPLVPSGSNRKA